ncbi:hypothetical protein [Ferrovibrio sp.]|uniref:hypothetical protein n=1 Tax=Ferrovibrio sp. TaxID=1917215 RepID=UPI00311D7E28
MAGSKLQQPESLMPDRKRRAPRDWEGLERIELINDTSDLNPEDLERFTHLHTDISTLMRQRQAEASVEDTDIKLKSSALIMVGSMILLLAAIAPGLVSAVLLDAANYISALQIPASVWLVVLGVGTIIVAIRGLMVVSRTEKAHRAAERLLYANLLQERHSTKHVVVSQDREHLAAGE